MNIVRSPLMALAAFALILPSTAYCAAEAEKELLLKQAAMPETLAALKEYKAAYAKIAAENGLSTDTAKPDVVSYYTDQFGKEYEKKNGGAKFAALDAHIGALTPEQIAAQYYYISKNPNPLGSKHLMDKSDDKSTYSTVHAKYHPSFKKNLEDNGLYDIFLVDPATGTTVYTVYKELDFFGKLAEGPNAGSGLGQAYQKALKAKKGEVVESSVDKYGFSYDVLALFIGTPIYDGDKLEGVLLYQVNP